MPRTLTKVRVHNPGVKKRLSLAQKLHFGTKRQRAAAKASLSRTNNPRYRGKLTATREKRSATTNRKTRRSLKGPLNETKSGLAKTRYYVKKSRARLATRTGNPGEIITLTGLGLAGNPGKRKVGNTMAKRRKSVSGVRRAKRRVRRATNPKVTVRYRTRARRRTNSGRVVRRRRSMRRRTNPGFLSGGVGMLVGIFGGAALTGAIASRVPGQLTSGIAGYLTTGVIAYAQGTLVGKVMKNPALGKNMVTGGLIYLGLKVASDLIPGLSLPFGLAGMGAIAPSNFSYPAIPPPNSMLYPSAAPATAVATRGMGRIARMGRMF